MNRDTTLRTRALAGMADEVTRVTSPYISNIHPHPVLLLLALLWLVLHPLWTCFWAKLLFTARLLLERSLWYSYCGYHNNLSPSRENIFFVSRSFVRSFRIIVHLHMCANMLPFIRWALIEPRIHGNVFITTYACQPFNQPSTQPAAPNLPYNLLCPALLLHRNNTTIIIIIFLGGSGGGDRVRRMYFIKSSVDIVAFVATLKRSFSPL